MDRPQPDKRRPGPPPAVMAEIRKHLSEREVLGLEALFTLRATAQHVDNAISEWMAGTVGSPARFQILMALWATKGDGISHKDVGSAMGVTRPTVSNLMAGLERDGLVTSYADHDDRRRLVARLTPKGNALVSKQFEVDLDQFRTVFAGFSSAELMAFTALLHRFRDGFAAIG